MYQQNPNYPQQPGFNYGYPQQAPVVPPGGPSIHINVGPQANTNGTNLPQNNSGGGGGSFGFTPAGLFAEKAIRQAFISKVYSLLTIQLILTSILIGTFVLNQGIKQYFARAQGWMFLGLGIFIVAYLVLICIDSAGRTSPYNLILLTILTLSYGLVAAIVSCRYNTNVVLYAFLATGISCFLIAAFARSTSFDMTSCGTTLCLIGLAHVLIGTVMVMVLVPLGYANVASLIYSVSGAMLASMYLVFDIQLIIGGRKHELSPEEYILAVVFLYIDIIQIFIYMLEIIKQITGDD